MFRNHPLNEPSRSFTPETISVLETNIDDTGATWQSFVNYTRQDYDKKYPNHLPDLSLSEQLQAGVTLTEVPTSGLLDSPDNLDYNNNITETINTIANE